MRNNIEGRSESRPPISVLRGRKGKPRLGVPLIDLSVTGEGQKPDASTAEPVDPNRLLKEIRKIEMLGRNARKSTRDKHRN